MLEINFRYRWQMYSIAFVIFCIWIWYIIWFVDLVDVNFLHFLGFLLLPISMTFFIWLPAYVAEYFR